MSTDNHSLDTSDEIRVAQLLSAKQAILLESKGLRHSRLSRLGGVRGLWAQHYGLPRNARWDAVIAKINAELDKLHPLEKPRE